MGRFGLLMAIVAMGCTTPKAAQGGDDKPAIAPVVEPVKTEAVVVEPVKTEPVKTEPVKTEPVKTEPVKTEPVKTEPVKTEPVKTEPVKTEPVKTEPVKTEPVKPPAKVEAAKTPGGRYTLVAIAAPDKKLERAWKSKCGSCHGSDGKAATEKGRKMKMNDFTVAAWQTARTNAELKKVITDGLKLQKDGVSQEMDGYADLGAEQVDALVQYVRWFGAPH